MTAKIEIFPLRRRALLRAERRKAATENRSNRFQQGLPVTVVQNGVRVREYPDGTLETLQDSRHPAD